MVAGPGIEPGIRFPPFGGFSIQQFFIGKITIFRSLEPNELAALHWKSIGTPHGKLDKEINVTVLDRLLHGRCRETKAAIHGNTGPGISKRTRRCSPQGS
jgi:hypothetical protein